MDMDKSNPDLWCEGCEDRLPDDRVGKHGARCPACDAHGPRCADCDERSHTVPGLDGSCASCREEYERARREYQNSKQDTACPGCAKRDEEGACTFGCGHRIDRDGMMCPSCKDHSANEYECEECGTVWGDWSGYWEIMRTATA